jgi:hypothetical protein
MYKTAKILLFPCCTGGSSSTSLLFVMGDQLRDRFTGFGNDPRGDDLLSTRGSFYQFGQISLSVLNTYSLDDNLSLS